MRYAGIARVLIFFALIIFLVVFIAPLGPFFTYAVVILVSLLFILVARIRPKPGNPLVGSTVGILAMSAAFVFALLAGGAAITGVSGNALDIIAFGVAFQAFVACGEELSFRGYVLEDLCRDVGLPAAVLLSSAAFALVHVYSMVELSVGTASFLIGLATIATAGVLLALLYVRSGLLSAIGFHFFWNILQYNVFGLGRQGEFTSLLHLSQGSNVLLTGGGYGPEASLPGLAIMLIAVAAVWYYYRQKSPRHQKKCVD